YWSPTNYDQPADFPSIEVAEYRAADGGELWLDLSLPFTNSPSMAQRIAKQLLRKSREELTVTMPAILCADTYSLQAGDAVTLTVDRYGWDSKEFDVPEWELALDSGANGGESGRAIGVNLILRETSEAIYSWSTDEEGEPPPSPNTSL